VWTRETAISFLNETFHVLRAQTDLSPGNHTVTHILRRLVGTLTGWHRAGFGADLANVPELAEARGELPRLCAAAERAMEKWWCRKVLTSRTPSAALADFWYIGNYRSLCKAESGLAGSKALREASFLGCGALPLTAILLAQADDRAHLRCVDADGEACDLAGELIRTLGLNEQIEIEHARAEACALTPGATVICASLLEAPGLYAHLTACGAARLLIRDAEGVYRWLYRPAVLPGPAFGEYARTSLSPTRINITRYFGAVHGGGTRAILAASAAED